MDLGQGITLLCLVDIDCPCGAVATAAVVDEEDSPYDMILRHQACRRCGRKLLAEEAQEVFQDVHVLTRDIPEC